VTATAPVSHQKRSHQNATNTINPNEDVAKSTIAPFILPLITVWLEVRVLPGPTNVLNVLGPT